MKKTSALSVFIFFAVIIFVAFTVITSVNFSDIPKDTPPNDILVHVSGCTGCDSLFVCVNGNTPYTPGKCDFYVDCYQFGGDNQTICVKCRDKSGKERIDCSKTKEVTIHLMSSLGLCPCE
jgi:hypothetical protein